MNAIKKYEQLTVIHTYDDKRYYSTAPVDEFMKLTNSKETKFIKIWDVALAVWDIRRFEIWNPSDMESFLFSLPREVKQRVDAREDELKKTIGKWWSSIEHINNRLIKENIKY